MNRWIQASLAVVLGFAALASQAQTCTSFLSPGADVTSAVINATPGSVICLQPGSYPGTGASVFPANGGFAIGNSVTVKGLGATPAQVVLQAISGTVDHTVYFVNYVGGKSSNGSALINLTIQGGAGGIQVQNFIPAQPGRPSDIKLKDVVITTVAGGNGFGVKLQSADRIVLDNVTVTSHQTALNFLDTTDSLVMNSTVPNTILENAAGLAVLGGSGNRFVNNTIGSPRLSAGAGYSFNGGGIVFYNTSENRFENNIVQGMRDDAVDFTTVDNVTPVTKSLNNYVGKNHIIHTGFALNGLLLGSAGIWANCASDGTWIYGNEVRGVAECGICIWGSRSNMAQGNLIYNNGITGIFVSGGQEAQNFCTVTPAATFLYKPANTYLQSNANYFNRNDQVNVRNADNTDITRSFASANSGLGGPAQSCTNPQCQAAMSLETDAVPGAATTGVRALANTSINVRGLWNDSATVTGLDFYLNRTINSTNSRFVTVPTVPLDRGPVLGGNYWSNFFPAGNPSANPFTGVFDSVSNTTGRVIDRNPYQSESLGRGYNISIFEPRLGSSFAQGSRRTVRWDSLGCVFVDLTLSGAALEGGTSVPNIGYAIVTIPQAAAIGSATITATCKDSGGTVRGSANSPAFSVSSSELTLLSPGRDDVFNAGTPIWVAWKNTNPGTISAVAIDYSTDGGATWPTTLTTVAQTATTPVTSIRLTLPATGTASAMIRVRNNTTIDQTDGVFSVRGASGAFSNVSAGRTFVMGQMERLEWSSPTNSRLVTINATANGNTVNVATDLPDRGSFDWIPQELGAGTLSLTANFKTIAGAAISSVTNGSSGLTRYPTTITLGAPPTIGPSQAGTLSATANSGAAVTLTGSTPSICTVSGTTVTGVANGTCTITANAPATGVFVAALPSAISFAIGSSQTITFAATPGYIAVGGTINLSATASSGLPVVFSSLTPGACSISGGNILTGNTVGTCTVAADQPGNGSTAAAQRVQRNIQAVAPADIPRLVNIATRMQVLTGADVMIAGFIIGGNQPKTVVVRARGPSLTAFGVPGALANPVLQLFTGQTPITSNDNWQQAANQATLLASGFAPSDPLEAAIYVQLAPGAYTGIVTGANGGTGVAIVEVFEVDLPGIPLINIATRGQVQTGGNVMIAGFIIQGSTSQTVVIRARGPSLAAFGVPGVLANPKLEIYSGQTVLHTNDDWQSAANASTVQSLGFAPADPLESVVLVTLAPGAYTAIVTGVGNTTGVGIVEVFGVQ